MMKTRTALVTLALGLPALSYAVQMKLTRPELCSISHHVVVGEVTDLTTQWASGNEGGIERTLSRKETPDGRPGVAVLLFTMDSGKLQTQLRNRVGQCVLTSPGSACYAGLEGEKKLKLGASLRFFGDGWQMWCG